MVDPETIPRLMAAGTIEVAPLAYMRGRAQPYDATVLTPSGCVELGSLSVGDLVIGSDGQPTAVLGVYPQGVRPIYQVATVDGGRTLACGEHLWTVRADTGGAPGEWRTVDTRALAATLAAGMPGPELPIVGQGLSDAPGRPIASVAPAGALDTLCIKVAASVSVPKWLSPATSPRSICRGGPRAVCGSCKASSRASRTFTSPT